MTEQFDGWQTLDRTRPRWQSNLPDGRTLAAYFGRSSEYNHIVAITLFGFEVNERGATIPNNHVATAFMKHIRLKGEPE